MDMPLLADVFFWRLVLFAYVCLMYDNVFDEIRTAVEWIDINDTGLEVFRTTGASNNYGSPPPSPPLLLECTCAAAAGAILTWRLLLSWHL